ncbi:MAG TPA: hypothetical protein VHA15_11985 [Burkholderiales bacterium]|nr:hypothetical protein [Burkholderiales bacterium]
MLNRKGAKAQRERKEGQGETKPVMSHPWWQFTTFLAKWRIPVFQHLPSFAFPLRLRAFAVKGLLS